jgi:hypothetical protein
MFAINLFSFKMLYAIHYAKYNINNSLTNQQWQKYKSWKQLPKEVTCQQTFEKIFKVTNKKNA